MYSHSHSLPALTRVAALLLIVTAGITPACIEPRYIRSTVIPAPTVPSISGSSLAKGKARVGLEINSWSPLGETLEAPKGPARPTLWVPRVQAGASFYKGLADWYAIGGHLRGASGHWTWPSTTDAPEFSERQGSFTGMFGLGMRFELPGGDKPLGMAVIGEINLMVIPDYTEMWEMSDVWPYDSQTLLVREFEYKSMLSPSLFFQIHTRLWEKVCLFALAGIESYPTNEPGRAATSGWPEPDTGEYHLLGDAYFLPGVGVELIRGPAYFSATVSFPMTDAESLYLGPAVTLRMGVME